MQLAIQNQFQFNDPAIVAAAEGAKARIQAAYIMAIQKPRNESQSRDRILKACRRTEFAERAEFAKPQGKKEVNGEWIDNLVTGPSIRFAELALREWGNIMTEVQILYEDDNVRRIRISALDLETNAQFTKDVQIKKTIERSNKKGREEDVMSERKNVKNKTVYILKATDEEMYMKEAAWISKVLRNEGLRLIPTDIIEEGMNIARQTVAKRDIQDPEGEKKKLLDSFSGIGISPKELESYLGHGVDTISPAQLKELRKMYASIRDGETTWKDYIKKDSDHTEKQEDIHSAIKGKKPEEKKAESVVPGMSNQAFDEIARMQNLDRESYLQATSQFGRDPQTDEEVNQICVIFDDITDSKAQ